MSLLYVRTAKTASSTMNAWCGTDFKVTFNQRFLYEPPNTPQIEDALAKGHVLITTVRDPWTRAISCWRQAHKSAWINNEVTFKDFLKLDFPTFFKSPHAITHTIPLTDYLEPYIDKIDKFIKVEKLDVELPLLAQQFGLKRDRMIGQCNPSRYMEDKTLKDVYDEETIQLVLDKYAKDFDTFNYSKTIDF